MIYLNYITIKNRRQYKTENHTVKKRISVPASVNKIAAYIL